MLTEPMALEQRFPIEVDVYDITWIKGRIHHVWIQKRPAYCDRGHYIAHVERAPSAGLGYSIYDADKWPRYYMNYDRMIAEIRDWLDWRESKGPSEAWLTP